MSRIRSRVNSGLAKSSSLIFKRGLMQDTRSKKYGGYLETNNGRSALWDAYQEAIDLVMYLRQRMLEEERKMRIGTQIAYVPRHAHGRLEHPDVQFGFVTDTRWENHFCRYWRRGEEGKELRTTANSECTPDECLVKHDSVEQSVVDEFLLQLGYLRIPGGE